MPHWGGERLRNFRYLWLGQIISLLGDWFNLIASATLVAQLTDSGLAIGTLFVIRALAPFLIGPIAGVVADRYNRKQILIWTDIGRALAVLGFLFVRDPSHVWLLYALTAVQLGISGFFYPTRSAILPDITSPRELGTANALTMTTWSVMLTVGAAIGGVVSGTWGIYPAFTIDALTFLLSALVLMQIRLDKAPALANSEKTVRAALSQYVDGLRYLANHIDIFVITLHKSVAVMLFGRTFTIVLIAIAEGVFVMGEGGGLGLGLMLTMTGFSTGIGPIIVRHFTGDRNRPLRWAIFFGYLITGLGLAIVAPLFSFGGVLFGILIRGFGGGVIWMFSTQLLLQALPDQMRGRVFATEFATFSLMGAVGATLVGRGLDSSLGISGVTWWIAGVTTVCGLLWGLWLVVGKSAEPASEEKAIL